MLATIQFRDDCCLSRLPTHLYQPFPSHHRSSRHGGQSTFPHLMGPMWPSRIFLTLSTVRCASTSLPMNSFYFTRPIKRGLLVPTSNATGDSETSLLTIKSSEVEWSASISSWVIPGFTASPRPAAVQMNGSSTSLDLQLPLLLECQICHPAFFKFSRSQGFITCFTPKISSPNVFPQHARPISL